MQVAGPTVSTNNEVLSTANFGWDTEASTELLVSDQNIIDCVYKILQEGESDQRAGGVDLCDTSSTIPPFTPAPQQTTSSGVTPS